MLIPIKYNLRYIFLRWTSTLMTSITFGMVIAVFIIVMSLAEGLDRAFVSTGDPLNLLILRPGVQSEGQSSIMIDRYQVIRNWPGIEKDANGEPMCAPESIVLVNKPKEPDGKPSNLQIRGVHPQSWALHPQVEIIEGKKFEPGLRQVIVSQSVSKRFQNMKIGDQVQLGKGPATIVGIFDAKGTAFDSEMWTDYQELMQEFDRDSYNVVILRAMDSAAIESLKYKVDEDQRVKLMAKTELEYYEEQTRSSGPIKALGIFLAVVMSIGACFAGMNTMYANVSGRTKEIGTLRVLGFTPISILVCFLIESICLALIGGILGCVISQGMNGIATGTTNFQTFSEVVFFFSINWSLRAKGMIFAFIMGLIGGFLPAIGASRQPILSALKQI